MNCTHMSCRRLLFLSILLVSLLEIPLARACDNTNFKPNPKSSASFFISGHSLIDNPDADYLVRITNSFGVKSEYNQQIIVGSPIRVRTRGDTSNSADLTGYKIGKNREGSGMDILKELKGHNTIQSKQYDDLIITERHDLVSTVI